MNIKVRLRNRTFMVTLISFIVAFNYNIISLIGVAPSITENEVLKLVDQATLLLSGLGVFIDPTTKGITDSEQAMSYTEPKGE